MKGSRDDDCERSLEESRQLQRGAPNRQDRKAIGEAVSDFAGDVTRKAGKQFARAKGMLTPMKKRTKASQDYPHVTLALAAGVGFLLGVLATS